jgi:hypothetical protein
VVRRLYIGIGAETRPDTVHGHVHYVTVCTDHHNIRDLKKSLIIIKDYRL